MRVTLFLLLNFMILHYGRKLSPLHSSDKTCSEGKHRFLLPLDIPIPLAVHTPKYSSLFPATSKPSDETPSIYHLEIPIHRGLHTKLVKDTNTFYQTHFVSVNFGLVILTFSMLSRMMFLFLGFFASAALLLPSTVLFVATGGT